MWRTRPCDRRDPGTGNSATNSKLPRPSIKAASDHAGPLRTPFPSRRLRFLKPRQVVVCLVEPRSNGIARETRRLPPKTHEFSCRPPRKSSRPLENLQKTRYATSRNPRNGAAILAVLRLNLLARPVAATKVEGSAGRVWSAVSLQRSAFGVIFVTSPRFAEKLQIKTLSSFRMCSPQQQNRGRLEKTVRDGPIGLNAK